MKIKSLTGSPIFGAAGFGPASGQALTMTKPLIMVANPVDPLHAATKQYIDTQVTNIPSDKVDTGTINVARIGVFTGDVSKSSGSGAITLLTNGVSAGVYERLTIDVKGRVSAGGDLTTTDIPDMGWNKFTFNKPTSLSGYGVTNALSKTGGTLTGFLTINSAPTVALHVANKAYADSKVSQSMSFKTGDIIARPNVTTPTGFLKCNGSEVSKTMYSALYAVVGDQYSYDPAMGNGRPWQLQHRINVTQNNTIGSFGVWPTPISGGIGAGACVVTKNKVYLLGGLITRSRSSYHQTAVIDTDGQIGQFAMNYSEALPDVFTYTSAVVVKNRIYVLGGVVNTVTDAKVLTSVIDSNGNIGAWSYTTNLPAAINRHKAIVIKNKLYIIGGQNSNNIPVNTIYRANIDSNGLLDNWEVTTSLPMALSEHEVFTTKQFLYVIGGKKEATSTDPSINVYSKNVYRASIDSYGNLGSWIKVDDLPVNLTRHYVVATTDKVFVFSGLTDSFNGATNSNVYVANINSDGTLGAWTYATGMMRSIAGSYVFATSAGIYTVGGVTGTSTVSTEILFSSFSGGLNDYSAYLAGTITNFVSDKFILPDYNIASEKGMYYFIKT